MTIGGQLRTSETAVFERFEARFTIQTPHVDQITGKCMIASLGCTRLWIEVFY